MPSYEAFPMIPTPERASIVSRILRGVAKFDTVFSDEQAGECEAGCLEDVEQQPCAACEGRLREVSRALSAPDSIVFEVWKQEEEEEMELAGIIFLANVRLGEDADGHYVFFDHDLRGKTGVIRSVIDWLFEEREDWKPLQRVTVKIPDYAFALARHAHRYLGFGGDFEYRMKGGTKVFVEGVKREAMVWRGKRRDVLQMGLLREEAEAA